MNIAVKSPHSWLLLFLAASLYVAQPCAGEEPESVAPAHVAVAASGTVKFETPAGEDRVPARFHLENHEFSYTSKLQSQRGEVDVYKVTFPSPVKTEIEENNTVHGWYFQPAGPGPFPATVVLHILGGDFVLSQTVANAMARKGVAALFIQMPYYGDRRRPGHPRRMMSDHVPTTIEGMTQAALDIRRAVAWLRARPEVDKDDLAINGISLGGVMSTIGAAAEPRIRKVAVILAGANLGPAIWDSGRPEAGKFREVWEKMGGDRASFIKAVEPIEPLTYGPLLRERHVLMIVAEKDEIFPVDSSIALWKAVGEQEIVWLKDAGHYTALLYIMREIERMGDFLKRPLKELDAAAAARKMSGAAGADSKAD